MNYLNLLKVLDLLNVILGFDFTEHIFYISAGAGTFNFLIPQITGMIYLQEKNAQNV